MALGSRRLQEWILRWAGRSTKNYSGVAHAKNIHGASGARSTSGGKVPWSIYVGVFGRR